MDAKLKNNKFAERADPACSLTSPGGHKAFIDNVVIEDGCDLKKGLWVNRLRWL